MYLEWIEMIYISVFDDFNYHAIRMKKCSVVKKKKKEVCPICARYEKGWEFDMGLDLQTKSWMLNNQEIRVALYEYFV